MCPDNSVTYVWTVQRDLAGGLSQLVLIGFAEDRPDFLNHLVGVERLGD